MRALGLSLLAIGDVVLGIFLSHKQQKWSGFAFVEIFLIVVTAFVLVQTVQIVVRRWRS